MLQEYLKKLCKEFNIELPELNGEKFYPFRFGEELILIKDLHPGASFYASICEVPTQKKEELFMFLMRANLLGQGTGLSRIGLDANEKFLTLSLGLPYEINYPTFRDTFEDFVNYLIYWREEVAKLEHEERIL